MSSAEAYAFARIFKGKLAQEIARENPRRRDRPVECRRPVDRRLSRIVGHTTLQNKLKDAIPLLEEEERAAEEAWFNQALLSNEEAKEGRTSN